MIDLASFPLWSILLASIAALLAASEIGRWFGARTTSRGGENVSTLEGAMLGLLALMIGFTFAMALSRYETRREAVLAEANAIGTAALRARLLPEPHRAEVLALLKQYLEIRLEVTQGVATENDLDAIVTRSGALHEPMWRQAQGVAAQDAGMVPTGLFIESLNDVIDQHENRITALRGRVPDVVFLALYAVAAVASGFAGYASGLERGSSRLPVHLTGALIAGVILLIQDLDRPTAGFIATSQQPLVDTYTSFTGWSE
jgi:hypothetical protein